VLHRRAAWAGRRAHRGPCEGERAAPSPCVCVPILPPHAVLHHRHLSIQVGADAHQPVHLQELVRAAGGGGGLGRRWCPRIVRLHARPPPLRAGWSMPLFPAGDAGSAARCCHAAGPQRAATARRAPAGPRPDGRSPPRAGWRGQAGLQRHVAGSVTQQARFAAAAGALSRELGGRPSWAQRLSEIAICQLGECGCAAGRGAAVGSLDLSRLGSRLSPCRRRGNKSAQIYMHPGNSCHGFQLLGMGVVIQVMPKQHHPGVGGAAASRQGSGRGVARSQRATHPLRAHPTPPLPWRPGCRAMHKAPGGEGCRHATPALSSTQGGRACTPGAPCCAPCWAAGAASLPPALQPASASVARPSGPPAQLDFLGGGRYTPTTIAWSRS